MLLVVFAITIAVCLAASTFGIRLALKVDPAEALRRRGKIMLDCSPQPIVRSNAFPSILARAALGLMP